MKRYRISLDVVVEANSLKKAERLEERMIDAVSGHLVASVTDPIKEVTDE